MNKQTFRDLNFKGPKDVLKIFPNAFTASNEQEKQKTLSQVLEVLSPTPQELNGFVLGKTIGEGTFSKVKLAKHIKSGQNAAIKIISKESLTTKTIEQVTREILLLCTLNHPNICPMLQLFDTTSDIYLVMEYQPGGEFFGLLEKGALPEPVARQYFVQIVSAISYCHSLGIIHRDLKPENILMNENQIKIADFGFANIQKSQGFDSFCGSLAYCSPELIAHKPYKGPEIDTWAIGVILFIMVCGYMPFDDSKLSKMYVAITTAKYVLPATLSEECKHLIKNILKPNPSERYTLLDIMQHPWVQSQPIPPNTVNNNDIVTKELLEAGFKMEEIQEFYIHFAPGPIKTYYYLKKLYLKRSETLLTEIKKSHTNISSELPELSSFSFKMPSLDAWAILKGFLEKQGIPFVEQDFVLICDYPQTFNFEQLVEKDIDDAMDLIFESEKRQFTIRLGPNCITIDSTSQYLSSLFEKWSLLIY